MASKRKWPPGIFKRKVCWKCSERHVEVKGDGRNKKTGYKCVHDSECPDSKKYEPDYWIRFRDRGKYVIEPAGPKLSQAKKALEARKGEIAQGRFDLADTKPGMEFKKFAEGKYLPFAKVEKKSWDRDDRSLKHLIPYFGDMPLNKITKWTVENYKKERLEEISPRTGRHYTNATVNRELACLRRMFNLALDWGDACTNPMDSKAKGRGVQMLEERGRERYLELDEIARLLEVSKDKPKLKMMILLAIRTGQRKSNILNLKWENVNLREGFFILEGQYTKNGEPITVELDDDLMEELRQYRKNCSGDYVFPGKNGKPLEDPRGALYKAFREAGLPVGALNNGCTFHTFRHTWTTLHLLYVGTDEHTLQKMGNWKTSAMVKRYSHLANRKHKREQANRLADKLKISPGYSEKGVFKKNEDAEKNRATA